MAFTLTEIDQFIVDLKLAYRAVITGKAYTINTGGTTRSLTRQDGAWIKKELQYWNLEREKELSGKKGLPTKFGTVHREWP